ncbi:leucine-rich repeat-containing protein 20 isoform X1 [Sardina pilchardus]|uniref:leucine-rich repeat-containing protein 20 isoform X1 n=2 Tax=Sardina pilchardus TaxID=27697 RepID=UPI002E14FECD
MVGKESGVEIRCCYYVFFKMAQDVANVARRVNEAVEEGKTHLDLSNCKLISFPDGVFKVLRTVIENIHSITLANNELKALTNKFFATFVQLRELDLQGNVLTKLPDAVGEMEHLTSINLSQNKLTSFPERLTNIRTLENINLENNQISDVPVEKLSSMPALKTVNVRSNPLEGQPPNISSLSFELAIDQ